jgi:predicted RecA/RadA family phage recombinase
MKNYVQRGDTLDIVAAAAVSSGDVVIAGSIIGVANVDAEIGESFALDVVGVFTLPKTSALAISVGDVLYYDAANSVVNKTASGNTMIGVAVTAAANPSPSVNVRLNGAF